MLHKVHTLRCEGQRQQAQIAQVTYACAISDLLTAAVAAAAAAAMANTQPLVKTAQHFI